MDNFRIELSQLLQSLEEASLAVEELATSSTDELRTFASHVELAQ